MDDVVVGGVIEVGFVLGTKWNARRSAQPLDLGQTVEMTTCQTRWQKASMRWA